MSGLEDLVSWKESKSLFKRKIGEVIEKYGREINELSWQHPGKSALFLWTQYQLGALLPGEMQRGIYKASGLEGEPYFKKGMAGSAMWNVAKIGTIAVAVNHGDDQVHGFLFNGGLGLFSAYTLASLCDFTKRIVWYSHGSKILDKLNKSEILDELNKSKVCSVLGIKINFRVEDVNEKRPTGQASVEMTYLLGYKGGKKILENLSSKIRNSESFKNVEPCLRNAISFSEKIYKGVKSVPGKIGDYIESKIAHSLS